MPAVKRTFGHYKGYEDLGLWVHRCLTDECAKDMIVFARPIDLERHMLDKHVKHEMIPLEQVREWENQQNNT